MNQPLDQQSDPTTDTSEELLELALASQEGAEESVASESEARPTERRRVQGMPASPYPAVRKKPSA